MRLRERISSDYFKLFVKREGKVVLGQNNHNIWLLTLVLTATFIAIAFSNGSMRYLAHKMDDPFVNWVDINIDNAKGGRFEQLKADLSNDELKEQFKYESFQVDNYTSEMFQGPDPEVLRLLRIRFFGSMDSPIISEITNDRNSAERKAIDLSQVDEHNIGVIITSDAVRKLGFTTPPPFIHYNAYNPDADSLGFDPIDNYIGMPIPVLSVVDRLPGQVDMIATNNLYHQFNNDNTHPFSVLANPEYGESLYYFVPGSVDYESFSDFVQELIDGYDELDLSLDDTQLDLPEMRPMKEGDFVSIENSDGAIPCDISKEIHKAIQQRFFSEGVTRVYEYPLGIGGIGKGAYVSVYFHNIKNITDFAAYVKSEYGIDIEMSQINAKENFNAVSLMANILSWVMIAFAIICIILFIVNLLQSYFQKVKKNLGTFKAFGISTKELIQIYLLIMLAIVASAIVISLAITYACQLLLFAAGAVKDGYNFLALWNTKTLISIVIILGASIITVYSVMHSLLKNTPGDLIYDRQ